MNTHSNELDSQLDLRRYANAIWRGRKLIVLSTLIAMVAAFALFKLEVGSSDGSADSATAPYRASATLSIESSTSALSSSALMLLGLGEQDDQGVETHVEMMQSRNVMVRAAEILRDTGDAEPQAGSDAELQAATDELQRFVTVRALGGRTDLIEVIAYGTSSDLARSRSGALVSAYQEFLWDRQFESVQAALDSIEQRLLQADSATTVTPEVIALLSLVSRELEAVRRTVVSSAEELSAKESEISAAIRQSTNGGTGAPDGELPGDSPAVGDPAQIALASSADALRFVLQKVDAVSLEFSRAELESTLSREVAVLTEGIATLTDVSTELGALATSLSGSSDSQASEQLRLVSQRLAAVAVASGEVASQVRDRQALGLAGTSERELLTEHISASITMLQGVVAAISAVRQAQSDGHVFVQLVSAEARVKNVSAALVASSPAAGGSTSGGAAGRLENARRELAGALAVTDQLLDRAGAEAQAGGLPQEIQRSLVNQVREASTVLAATAATVEEIRKLGIQGANTASLIEVEFHLNSLSDSLAGLRELTAVRESLHRIGGSSQVAANLIEDVRDGTSAGDSRYAVTEIGVRLTAASSSLSAASEQIRGVLARDALAGDSDLSLVAHRIQGAGANVRVLADRLPQIQGSSSTEIESLVSVRNELELLLLAPQDDNVSTVASNVLLTPGNQAASGADLRFLVGGLAGLLVGIIGSVTLEITGRRVWSGEDVRSVLGSAPLGSIARADSNASGNPPAIADQPLGAFAESLHLVANRIETEMGGKPGTVLISGPRPGVGKTTLAMNIARVFILRGRSVVLVDANLRKPDATELLGCLGEPGLANALQGSGNLEPRLVEGEGYHFVPAGQVDAPPIELLSRPAMDAMVSSLERRYEMVIFDGPPALGFADTEALARHAGYGVLVAKIGATDVSSLRDSHELLTVAGLNNLAVVMNFASASSLGFAAVGQNGPTERGIPGLRLISRRLNIRVPQIKNSRLMNGRRNPSPVTSRLTARRKENPVYPGRSVRTSGSGNSIATDARNEDAAERQHVR